MNYAITVGDVVMVFVVLAGLAMLAGGFLTTFAAGMSSNPSESDRVGRKGCWTMVVGLVVLIAAATAIWS